MGSRRPLRRACRRMLPLSSATLCTSARRRRGQERRLRTMTSGTYPPCRPRPYTSPRCLCTSLDSTPMGPLRTTRWPSCFRSCSVAGRDVVAPGDRPPWTTNSVPTYGVQSVVTWRTSDSSGRRKTRADPRPTSTSPSRNGSPGGGRGRRQAVQRSSRSRITVCDCPYSRSARPPAHSLSSCRG